MPIPFLKNWTIDMTKIPHYSAFKSKYELKLDYEILNMMWQSTNPVYTDDRKRLLLPILNAINKETGVLEVTHSPRFGAGRFYPNGSISPISISRQIKHTLFTFLDWIDLDMVKGHPTMLVNIARLCDVDLPAFTKYLANFDGIVDMLTEFYSVGLDEGHRLPADKIKDIFNIHIYGGGMAKWFSVLEEDGFEVSTNQLHPFIKEFKNDCKIVSTLVYANNREMINKIKGDETEEYKIKNKAMSYFCGTIENEIIHICYKTLVAQGVIKPKRFALEYDGICCPRPATDSGINLEDVLIEINAAILSRTGMNVIMKWKPYNPIHVDRDIIHQRINMIPPIPIAVPIGGAGGRRAGDVAVIQVAGEEDTLDMVDTYELFKQIFERDHFKCIETSTFYKENKDTDELTPLLSSFTEHNLRISYKHLNYETISKSGKAITNYYVDEWLNDQNIRVYNKMDTFPPPLKCPAKTYNKWTPFRAQTLVALEKDESGKCIVPLDDAEYLQAGVGYIMNHILAMCGNEQEIYEFFTAWMGCTLAWPAIKTTMPHIIGDQGSGKSEITKILERLIGASKCFTSTIPETNIFGTFNGHMEFAYLVFLEELSAEQTLKAEGQFKDLITGSLIEVNKKGVTPIKIKSFHKFMATSNNITIKTNVGDRRNFMFKASNQYTGNVAYFADLRKFYEDDRVIMLLYERLVSIPDLQGLKSRTPPLSNYQRVIQQSNRDNIDLFAEHFARQHHATEKYSIQSIELFNEYLSWAESQHITSKISCKKFICAFRILPFGMDITSNHTRAGTIIHIQIPTMILHYGIINNDDVGSGDLLISTLDRVSVGTAD